MRRTRHTPKRPTRHSSRATAPRRSLQHRRLVCEPLEDRRLLSVAPFAPTPSIPDEFAIATSAQVAVDFTVNSTADDPDANPGDGLALTSDGVTTLRAAIMEANALEGDSTITLPAGTYTLTLSGADEDASATGDLDITDTTGSLTILGADAETTIIDGVGLDRVFEVTADATANLTDLTITGGASPEGGGVHTTAGTVTITRSTVSGNSSTLSEANRSYGGGLYNNGGTLSVIDSQVSGNSTPATTNYSNGGGIYNYCGTLTIVDSQVVDNSAGYAGGGIYTYVGITTVTGSTIESNALISEDYAGYGGGIYTRAGTLTLADSTVTRNSTGEGAYTSGGGVYGSYSTLAIVDSIICDNASYSGGGVTSSSGVLTVTDSTLSGNSAVRLGGGIACSRGRVTVTGSTISSNSVDRDRSNSGGGIHAYYSTLDIANSTVSDNLTTADADTHGGGIYGTHSTVTIDNSTISGNSATSTGSSSYAGVIYNERSTLSVTASTLSANSADSTGAIHNDRGTALITSSTITGNSSGDYGGGINNDNGTVKVANSTISNNSAELAGGGIHSTSGSVSLQSTIIAGSVGGAADLDGKFASEGHNLIGNIGSATGFQNGINGDLVGGYSRPSGSLAPVLDPMLAALADNGGSTMTHALLPGSPAIDAGSDSDSLGMDQRGFLRPRDGDHDGTLVTDIGAFEAESVLAARLVVDDVSVTEGASGTVDAVFTVTLLEPSDLTVTVDYATADAYIVDDGNDYLPASGTLTFAPGEITKTVTVTIQGDDDIEPDEKFSVNLSNVTNAGIVDAQGIGTIVNDDVTGFVVNTVEDGVDANPGDGVAETSDGKTSLRAAIMEANALAGHQTIVVPAGRYALTLIGAEEDEGATGDLDIDCEDGGDLTILGAGEGSTVIDGLGHDRVFETLGGGLFDSSAVNLSWMTVTRGRDNSGGAKGGGITHIGGATLTVNQMTISDNHSSGRGGGISSYALGNVIVTNSTVRNNYARFDGGGIRSDSPRPVTIINSIISGNRAGWDGGGISISTWGEVTVSGSTISNNDAGDSGGGIENGGDFLAVTNSTISGNRSGDFGGGIYNDASSRAATTTITNSTITSNQADLSGGGFYNDYGRVRIRNTIIAANQAENSHSDMEGGFSSSGHNLVGDIGDATGFTHGVNGDLVGGGDNPALDPMLGPLADNGGATLTHALLPGSPAIDSGDDTDLPETDQRGSVRVFDGDRDGTSTVDIGAVEATPNLINLNNHAIGSYAGGQDASGSATVEDGGATLRLSGNTWKQIDFAYTITADTILAFDFQSSRQGEIHAIGFDDDLILSGDRAFQLHGTDRWGLGDFWDYAADTPGVKHYEIPVGQFYTGQMTHLFFTSDHDAAPRDAESIFSNIQVYTPGMIDLRDHTIGSYAGGQDAGGTAMVEDDGATMRLEGNAWKQFDFDYTITPNTVLSFDFQSDSQGEIHAVGFDDDLVLSGDRAFQIYGTDRWGFGDFKDYATTSPGVTHYDIPVGQFYTGDVSCLFFANDHDLGPANGESVYSNIRVHEDDTPLDPDVVDFGGHAIGSYAGGQDAGGTARVADGGATLKLSGNAWKQTELAYTVTPDTMLAFDFSSAAEGEIHAIGFDDDLNLSGDRAFQLYGTDRWGLADFNNYTAGDGVKHYEIPVGQFFTGQMSHLFFTNDHDIWPATAESIYSNIRIYESAAMAQSSADTTEAFAYAIGLLGEASNQSKILPMEDGSVLDDSPSSLFGDSTGLSDIELTRVAADIVAAETRVLEEYEKEATDRAITEPNSTATIQWVPLTGGI